jgi:hypothetical protein
MRDRDADSPNGKAGANPCREGALVRKMGAIEGEPNPGIVIRDEVVHGVGLRRRG